MGCGCRDIRKLFFLAEIFFQQTGQTRQGDAVRAARLGVKPVAQREEFAKRRTVFPNQRCGFDEAAAVGNQIPVVREPAEALHRGKVEIAVLENLVRRLRIVNHLPLGGMAGNGRAAETFQNADLDFVRLERDEPVEPGGKAVERFARQADDEVGVDVDAGVRGANGDSPRLSRCLGGG